MISAPFPFCLSEFNFGTVFPDDPAANRKKRRNRSFKKEACLPWSSIPVKSLLLKNYHVRAFSFHSCGGQMLLCRWGLPVGVKFHVPDFWPCGHPEKSKLPANSVKDIGDGPLANASGKGYNFSIDGRGLFYGGNHDEDRG